MQSTGKPKTSLQRFDSPDHTVHFQYSYPLIACHDGRPGRPSSCDACGDQIEGVNILVCVGYSDKIYKGYNVGPGPALAIGTIDSISDEATCLDIIQDSYTSKQRDKIFNNTTFKSAFYAETNMSQTYQTTFYRSFRYNRCYSLTISLKTVALDVLDPGTKKFKETDQQSVMRTFGRLLDTLRLTSE